MSSSLASTAATARPQPDISLVMPCYNEEEVVGYTIRRLVQAFEQAGHKLELIAVDNGSVDRTSEVIRAAAAQYAGVIHSRVNTNQGYGSGILSGIPLATAPWIGFIPADGQVDAEDVVRLYDAIIATNGCVLGKVRRRFRMDGFMRKAVSSAFNLITLLLWPHLGSLDVNGTPKILPRDAVAQMALQSRGWLLDAEIMIKAERMALRVLELNVFARARSSGVSHVRPETVVDFLRQLLYFRFSPRWRRDLQRIGRYREAGGARQLTVVRNPE